MRFGIKHLLLLMLAIGLVFTVFDRLQVERRAYRSETWYGIAKIQNDQMRARLDQVDPDWRSEVIIAPKFEELPEPAAWFEEARFSGTFQSE